MQNTLADYSKLLNDNNRKIKWKYITELVMQQQKEGLNFGNKLCTAHIKYKI